MNREEAMEIRKRAKAEARSLANAYRVCFSSASGKRVLEDLERKYSPDRPRFTGACAVTAALRDGESNVVFNIRQAMRAAKTLDTQDTQ
jgi:hypothetical protein